MNNIRKYTAWLGAGAILITLATGCANKDNDLVPDATENVVGAGMDSSANMADGAMDTTGNMADAAGNNMAEGMDSAGNMADAAGTNMAQGAQSVAGAVGGAADAAIYTPKIKTAFAAQPALNGSEINVDTLPDNKIALRGTVTSSAQKTMAESIAQKNAPEGFTIVNQLTMGGKM